MKKRLALSILAIAAISLIVSAATFALFSDETSNVGNTFTAGTVELGGVWEEAVDLDNLAPGDSGDVGTFVITYTGSLEAWLGLDTAVSGDIFLGDALDLTIRDEDGNSYEEDMLEQVVGKFNNGDSVTFTVDYDFDLNADNSYQGDSGTFTMKVYAVQARNNTNAGGTGPISWN